MKDGRSKGGPSFFVDRGGPAACRSRPGVVPLPSIESGVPMGPQHQEIRRGLALAAIAVVSAIVSASLVVGAGRVLLPQARAQAKDTAPLILVADTGRR